MKAYERPRGHQRDPLVPEATACGFPISKSYPLQTWNMGTPTHLSCFKCITYLKRNR